MLVFTLFWLIWYSIFLMLGTEKTFGDTFLNSLYMFLGIIGIFLEIDKIFGV